MEKEPKGVAGYSEECLKITPETIVEFRDYKIDNFQIYERMASAINYMSNIDPDMIPVFETTLRALDIPDTGRQFEFTAGFTDGYKLLEIHSRKTGIDLFKVSHMQAESMLPIIRMNEDEDSDEPLAWRYLREEYRKIMTSYKEYYDEIEATIEGTDMPHQFDDGHCVQGAPLESHEAIYYRMGATAIFHAVFIQLEANKRVEAIKTMFLPERPVLGAERVVAAIDKWDQKGR